ncbi:MAG: hydrolase [bacterium]
MKEAIIRKRSSQGKPFSTSNELEFFPAWWLPEAHSQTLWNARVRRVPSVNLLEETLELPDQDFLEWFWLRDTYEAPAESPTILILHGLEGCARSNYVQDLMRQLGSLGWRVVVMQYRNCGEKPNRLAQSYHAMRWQELDWTVENLRGRFPEAPIGVVGFSIGGSILLNWLGQNEIKHIATACAISVPYKLAPCADRLNQGFSKIYQTYLMGRLKRSAVRKGDLLKDALGLSDLSQINKLNTLWEFDDLLTAPLHGFKNVHDYYEKASCRQYLKSVQVPTLLVHALDDPFMVPEVVPQASELSGLIQTAFVPVGGHVGFVSGSFPGKEWSWLSQIVPNFFETNLY